MDATNTIRDAVAGVALRRQTAAENPGLARALSDIKHFQARRFAGTYFDLLQSERYKPAAFFSWMNFMARRIIQNVMPNLAA